MSARKILIITNRVPFPLRDGGNMAMNTMIEGYHKAGWQVHLLAMNTSRHHVSTEQLSKLFNHLHAFEWVEVDNSLRVVDIIKNYLFSKQPEHAVRFFSPDFKAKIKSVLKSFNPDVVQVESVFLTSYLPVIRKYSSAITILRMHNVEYQIWQGLSRKTKNALKKMYFSSLAVRVRNYERASWKAYDLLLAITEKDAYQVNRLEEVNNIIVAPFGIDIDQIHPNTGNERWVGYHIGAMDWIPNKRAMNWFLNKVWPKVHKAMPKFEFYFAGRGMPEEYNRLNLTGVHCLSEVASADEFIADKKILIVPITTGGGVRVKILEAMAAGKVVITTASGIKGIEAMPDEHYLRVHHAEDFVKAIKWCLNNKPAAEEMAAKARALIKEKYEQRKVISNITRKVELLLHKDD